MEEPLLTRIASGDGSAVSACMERYGNLVWSLALRLSPSRAEAEDAVQEIFIDLWSKAERFDPTVAAEPTFVAMIARRKLIDRFRSRRRQPVEPLDDAVAATIPVDTASADTHAQAAEAARALETLRPEQQKVLKLSIYDGLSHGDIAAALQMPLGTVKTHIRQGLIRIREALDAAGPGAIRQVTP